MEIISIIVPVYNIENYLEECIDSLLQQTYEKLEIILVDDGSKDSSGEICDNYAKKDNRITAYHIENSGPSKARNYGLEKATGEYVMFIDSDDWIEKHTLEACYEASHRYDSDIVLFNLCDFNDRDEIHQIVLNGEERYFEGKQVEYIENIMISTHAENPVTTQSIGGPVCKLYKREVLDGCFFPEEVSFGEDTCFVAQVLQNIKNLVYLNKSFYHRRLLEDSLSQASRTDYAQRRLAFVNWIVQFYKEKKTHDMLNIFCWNSYCVVVNKVIENKKINIREKNKLVREFLNGIQFSYDFSKIIENYNNPKIRLIKEMLKREKFILVCMILEISTFIKGKISTKRY